MTYSLLRGQDLGRELIKALGLPTGVLSIEIRCAVDELVKIRCELATTDGTALAKVFANYHIVSADAVEPAETVTDSLDFDAMMEARREASHRSLLLRYMELSELDDKLSRDKCAVLGRILDESQFVNRTAVDISRG